MVLYRSNLVLIIQLSSGMAVRLPSELLFAITGIRSPAPFYSKNSHRRHVQTVQFAWQFFP